MKNYIKNLRTFFSTGFFIYFIAISQISYATVALPDKPLYLGITVRPNIMLGLDDSGSMKMSYVLAATAKTTNNGIWKSEKLSQILNTNPDGKKAGALLLTCVGFNLLAYDPTAVYTPWAGKDSSGNKFVDQSATNAIGEPYDGHLTQNLTKDKWNSRSAGYIPFIDANGNGTYDFGECSDSEKNGNGGAGKATIEYADFVTVDSMTSVQQTNYANWYSYYSGRGKVLKKAASNIVNDSTSYMGLATMNNNKGVGTPISDMAGNNGEKENLLKQVFKMYEDQSTPLQELLHNVGQYFDQGGNDADHGDLGFTDSSPILSKDKGGECQKNFVLLMSDGAYQAPYIGVDKNGVAVIPPLLVKPYGDTDSGAGPYDGGPHADNIKDTLADIAMHWYETDLATGLSDKVSESQYTDPNTGIKYTNDNPQQHLVTHTIAFGLDGTGIVTPVDHDLNTPPPPWTDPKLNDITKLDDMQHAAFNGRGFFLSVRKPQELIDSIEKSFAEMEKNKESSGSSVAFNDYQVTDYTRRFHATFNPSDWSGELTAHSVNDDGTIDQEVWKATDNIPAEAARNIFTSYTNAGIEFAYGNGNDVWKQIPGIKIGYKNLQGASVIGYIRGVQTHEGVNDGNHARNRTELLGDIIGSSPISVGYIDLDYERLTGDEGTNYTKFLENKKTIFTDMVGDPQSVVYVGANDGMLHAFHDAQSKADAGKELFAYVPSSLHGKLYKLLDPDYSHEYYVNGGNNVSDVCIDAVNNTCKWKTIFVGTLNEGGRTIYALDVTNPFNFDENDVLWEYNFDDTRVGRDNSEDMGFVKGPPQIMRLNNGKWGVIFGNGYNSDDPDKTSQLFILDAEDGTEIAVIDTKIGHIQRENGMATPLVVDTDNDRIADYVYAGDLWGRLYKFDIRDSNEKNWDSVFKDSINPSEADGFFRAIDKEKNGDMQAITTKPTIIKNEDGGGYNIIFATGKYLEPEDSEIKTPYQTQTIYSILDDGKLKVGDKNGGRSELQKQVISQDDGQTRMVMATPVDYNGGAGKQGWYMDLVVDGANPAGERVITNPVIRDGNVYFSTYLPVGGSCTAGGDSYRMQLDALSGVTLLDNSKTDTNGDGIIDEKDAVSGTGGKKLSEGTVADAIGIYSKDGKKYEDNLSGISGTPEGVTDDVSTGASGRQSWRQLH